MISRWQQLVLTAQLWLRSKMNDEARLVLDIAREKRPDLIGNSASFDLRTRSHVRSGDPDPT